MTSDPVEFSLRARSAVKKERVLGVGRLVVASLSDYRLDFMSKRIG